MMPFFREKVKQHIFRLCISYRHRKKIIAIELVRKGGIIGTWV